MKIFWLVQTTLKMADKFCRQQQSPIKTKRFSIVLSEEGMPCGLINAFTAFAEIYIDDIWVDKAYRGKGYGRKLL